MYRIFPLFHIIHVRRTHPSCSTNNRSSSHLISSHLIQITFIVSLNDALILFIYWFYFCCRGSGGHSIILKICTHISWHNQHIRKCLQKQKIPPYYILHSKTGTPRSPPSPSRVVFSKAPRFASQQGELR